MGRQSPSRVRIPPSPPPAARLVGRFAAPVAQLDRASVYGTEGQRFESSRARYTTRKILCISRDFGLWCVRDEFVARKRVSDSGRFSGALFGARQRSAGLHRPESSRG